MGLGDEKTLLLKHLKESRRAPGHRDLRAEPSDRPTDREIVALGRRHFHLGEPVRPPRYRPDSKQAPARPSPHVTQNR